MLHFMYDFRVIKGTVLLTFSLTAAVLFMIIIIIIIIIISIIIIVIDQILCGMSADL